MHFFQGEIENPSLTALATTSIKGCQAIALAEKQIADATGVLQEPRVVVHILRKERRKVLVHKAGEGENESDRDRGKEVEVLQIVFSANPPKVHQAKEGSFV